MSYAAVSAARAKGPFFQGPIGQLSSGLLYPTYSVKNAWSAPANETYGSVRTILPYGLAIQSTQHRPKDPNMYRSPDERYYYSQLPIYG